ncbi:hypothetical protein PsorP6_006125 [Peronosclerospora sorghi]|uniref:Uncharacterized protein n=1 Tax=Peronosclerospora sorghi TaxID=230839 RepID=A0ACC0W1M9_9STRA|nr:hypothetical protein PsorP6_006125 [Peronosclerospora sorghi]
MSTLSRADVSELLRLLWPTTDDGTSDDSKRWYKQGFDLQALPSFPLGLVQEYGGPCGVLAAVQAEMLRLFLFAPHHRQAINARDIDLHELIERDQVAHDEEARRQLLAEAMASLLMQCANDDGAVRVVVQDKELTYRETIVYVLEADASQLLVGILLCEMPAFCSPHGVINFTYSVLRTKGVAVVRSEMDDSTSSLTGAFGHCTQELVNLLLTGQAVSNVFDGAVPLGESGLFLRGIPQQARIGYLTHLEALQYCQVGSYYKSPQFPVWVIGSSSHFSVGFSLDVQVSEESISTKLYQKVRRVFKQFDSMETGFIKTTSLATSLKQLGIEADIFSSERCMARLVSRLEISSNAGIVVWEDYWIVISVLLYTNDFELALSGEYETDDIKSARQGIDRSDANPTRQSNGVSEGNPSCPVRVSSQSSSSETMAIPRVAFDFFYYNGLRSSSDSQTNGRCPQLSKCRVEFQKLPEFIGKSVPIENVRTSAGHDSLMLDEILRTKWPHAQIEWLSSSVPKID